MFCQINTANLSLDKPYLLHMFPKHIPFQLHTRTDISYDDVTIACGRSMSLKNDNTKQINWTVFFEPSYSRLRTLSWCAVQATTSWISRGVQHPETPRGMVEVSNKLRFLIVALDRFVGWLMDLPFRADLTSLFADVSCTTFELFPDEIKLLRRRVLLFLPLFFRSTWVLWDPAWLILVTWMPSRCPEWWTCLK